MNPSTKLLIPRAIHDAIIEQARNEAPNECCGLLAGLMPAEGDYKVSGHFPLINALASPTAFESEPRGLLAAHRSMRDRGWEILGVYHSHPATPGVPSQRDRQMSYSGDIATVIVSLPDETMRAWWIVNDEYTEARIVVV